MTVYSFYFVMNAKFAALVSNAPLVVLSGDSYGTT